LRPPGDLLIVLPTFSQEDAKNIKRLLDAEERAAKIIADAYSAKSKLKERAENEAGEVNAKFEEEQKHKFAAEVEGKDDSSAEFDLKLKESMRKEIAQVEGDFSKSQDLVVGLLLHHVTTVKLEVQDALKQLALTQAKEKAASNEGKKK